MPYMLHIDSFYVGPLSFVSAHSRQISSQGVVMKSAYNTDRKKRKKNLYKVAGVCKRVRSEYKWLHPDLPPTYSTTDAIL